MSSTHIVDYHTYILQYFLNSRKIFLDLGTIPAINKSWIHKTRMLRSQDKRWIFIYTRQPWQVMRSLLEELTMSYSR